MAKKVPPKSKKSRAKKVGTARRPMFLDGSDMLIKATWLYHHRKLTQEQIAQQLGFSRPTIVRLLRQAAEQGLVTVSLRSDALSRVELSARRVDNFGLREAVLVAAADG